MYSFLPIVFVFTLSSPILNSSALIGQIPLFGLYIYGQMLANAGRLKEAETVLTEAARVSQGAEQARAARRRALRRRPSDACARRPG